MYIPSDSRYEHMEYRRAGKAGLSLPAISFGLWHNAGKAEDIRRIRDLMHTAFDLGITHFDLANNYGPPPGSAEENFGKVLHSSLIYYRNELVVSTKAGYVMWPGPYGDGGSRKYLLSSLEESLKRMKLDYVDIFYHHRMDPSTPLEETMSALNQAVVSGKALYVGLSNYTGPVLREAEAILKDLKCPFIINQNRYSLLDRSIEENGLISTAAELGKGIITFSPLAQGLLSDRYLHCIPDDSRMLKDGRFLKKERLTADLLEKLHRLDDFARLRGQSLAQMALSWILSDKRITSVLIGASSPDQLKENVKALENISFTVEEKQIIERIISQE